MKNHERRDLVVKSNDLIRKTRYELSEQEQKIIIYLISKIKAEDKELRAVTISIKEYCNICNIRYTGKTSQYIKKSIQNIADKSWWIRIDEDEEILFRWINDPKISRGKIVFQLSAFLEPYLLELKENFTKYELINVLALKGKFSIRLYELFKSYLWKKGFTMELEDIKKLLHCENYKTYKDFRVRVLDYSIKEINEYTDLEIRYKPIKAGKKVVKIQFTIKEKLGVQMTWDSLMNQIERLEQ